MISLGHYYCRSYSVIVISPVHRLICGITVDIEEYVFRIDSAAYAVIIHRSDFIVLFRIVLVSAQKDLVCHALVIQTDRRSEPVLKERTRCLVLVHGTAEDYDTVVLLVRLE